MKTGISRVLAAAIIVILALGVSASVYYLATPGGAPLLAGSASQASTSNRPSSSTVSNSRTSSAASPMRTCTSAPFNSTSPDFPYAVTFSRPGEILNWGITVDGVRQASNQTSITLNCPSPLANYSYDVSLTASNGTKYRCSLNCSGSVSLASTVSRLHVEGNKVKDESGNILVLRGVDLQEYGYATSYLTRYNESHFKYLAQQWQARIIRIPVVPSYWRGQHQGLPASDSSYYLSKILDPMVQLANKYGMYAIIDWHGEGNVNTPGKGSNVNDSLTSLDETMSFWSTISQHFSNRPGVLYEVFNEPGDALAWDTWKPTAQALVDQIRKYDNRTLILVAGTSWASDLSGIVGNPLNGKNVVYVVHPYPITAADYKCGANPPTWAPSKFLGCWDTMFGNASTIYPLFATEWGYYATDEDSHCDVSYAKHWEGYETQLTTYMLAKGISWSPWSWAPVPGSGSCFSMFRAGDIYQLTQFGQFVRDQLTSVSPSAIYTQG